MTADVTIEATPGQVAAIERDGFLAVVGPTRVCPCVPMDSDGCDGCPGVHPVPTTKPCGLCCGQGHVLKFKGGGALTRCRTCNGDGTVPITVEVVVPEQECPDDRRWPGRVWKDEWDVSKGTKRCPTCKGTAAIPARTLLRGTAEAVPVVDDVNDWPTEEGTSFLYVEGELLMLYTVDPEADDGYEGWDLSAYGDDGGHFADVPRPEVGDTAWIIRGEGS